MNKQKKSESGFSVVELILVIVIVALIGVVGWMVYKNHHKNSSKTISSNSQSSKTVISNSDSKTISTNEQYAGWKTYTTKYEKLSFKYPANWTLKDTSQSQGSGCTQVGGDIILLSSGEGSEMVLKNGVFSGTASPDTMNNYNDFTDPTKFLGQQAQFKFYDESLNNTNTGKVGLLILTNSSGKFFTAKNVGCSQNPGTVALWLSYGVNSKDGSNMANSLESVKTSNDYIYTKLIVQSMGY
jgi:Tfp pilus assembly protein PilE